MGYTVPVNNEENTYIYLKMNFNLLIELKHSLKSHKILGIHNIKPEFSNIWQCKPDKRLTI